jgi:hypothetical protein
MKSSKWSGDKFARSFHKKQQSAGQKPGVFYGAPQPTCGGRATTAMPKRHAQASCSSVMPTRHGRTSHADVIARIARFMKEHVHCFNK